MSIIAEGMDRYSLYDAVVKLTYCLQLPGGAWEKIPLGVYNITEANRVGSTIEIQAFDNMTLLDDEALMNFTAVDGHIFDVLGVISKLSGIPLAQTKEQIELLPNGKRVCGIDNNDNVKPKNLREILAYIAGLTGTVALMNRSGAIELRSYAKAPNAEITEDKQNATKISDYKISYGSLSMKIGADSYLVELAGATGLCYTMAENPMIANYDEKTRAEALSYILEAIANFEFNPSAFELITGDPAIDLCDMVKIRGISDTEDQRFNMLNMSYTWQYRGKHSMECLGSNPKLSSAQTKEEAQAEEALSTAEENKLIFNTYTNSGTYVFQPDQQRKLIATIKYTSIKKTSGEFKLQMLFEVSGSSPQTIAKFTYFINSNEITTVYPVETYTDGKHIVMLYYPLSIPEKGINTFDVYLETRGGQISVDKLHITATVIGQGLASMEESWDGKLSFEDTLPLLKINAPAVKLPNYSDSLTAVFPLEEKPTIQEALPRLTINPATIQLGAYSDAIIIGTSVKGGTVYGRNIIGYNPCLRVDAGRLIVKTVYTYAFTEQIIDSGKMCSIEINTEQFARVQGLEVI
ncbi:MAG: hypothetical protein RSD18_04865 [Anaerovoracaceae bacterium]